MSTSTIEDEDGAIDEAPSNTFDDAVSIRCDGDEAASDDIGNVGDVRCVTVGDTYLLIGGGGSSDGIL